MSIAIIYTTFLRDKLANKTLQSIYDNWSLDYGPVLIGNQNKENNVLGSFNLPFDCGLSYARNWLVQKANQLGCKYCLVTADSIEFTSRYDFKPIIECMENNNIDKIGFGLNNRVPWEYNMGLIPGKYFELTLPSRSVVYKGIEYRNVDICKNFFIAKTKILLDVPWDNDLKLSEHEDHCWRLKQTGHVTVVTNHISANYIDDKPEEYLKYRSRMYSEYRKLFLNKYNISNWVKRNS